MAIPNSMVLTHPVVNETFAGAHILHTIAVSVYADEWHEAEHELLAAAQEAGAPYLERARLSLWTLRSTHRAARHPSESRHLGAP